MHLTALGGLLWDANNVAPTTMLQLHFLLRLLSKQSNYRVLHRFAASIAADMVRVTVHYDFQHLHVTTLASGFS